MATPSSSRCCRHRLELREPFVLSPDLTNEAETADDQLRRLGKLVATCRHEWYALEYHSNDVATLSVRLARYVGFDERQIATLERGAFLHDIGKIFQPLAVILWPGAFTPEHWAEMHRHPAEGAALVTHPELADIRRLIHCHHEWPGNPATGALGGRGYPRGLSRGDLRDEEVALSVADWYAGIREHRIYRPAKDHAVAMKWTEEAAAEGKIDPEFTGALGRMLAVTPWEPTSHADTAAHAPLEAPVPSLDRESPSAEV